MSILHASSASALPTPSNTKKRMRDESSDAIDGMTRSASFAYESGNDDDDASSQSFSDGSATTTTTMADVDAECVMGRAERCARARRAGAVLQYILDHHDSLNQLASQLRSYFCVPNEIGCSVVGKDSSGNVHLHARKDFHKHVVADIRRQLQGKHRCAHGHCLKEPLLKKQNRLFAFAEAKNIPMSPL